MTAKINTSLEAFKERGRGFASGEGKGVQMKNFKPYTDFVLKNLVHKADIINPEALLPDDGYPVIAITSHGPGAAWIPLVALVGKFFIDNGYGDIVGGMYPHKALFLIPGLKNYYRRVLGTPTEIKSVDEIVALLKNNDIGLAGTAPEGANCLLTFKDYVAPFRSKGMIAAAIKADATISLMAHQGAEDWNIRINLPFGWTVPYTNGVRGINITLPPYKKIDYMALCRRYTPSISSVELGGKTKREARMLLNIEIENIRMQLNSMTDEVREMMGKKALTPKKAQGQKIDSWQRKQLQIQQAMFPLDEAYLACN